MRPKLAVLKHRQIQQDPANGLWERLDSIRSFLWTQDITDEAVLLNRFLIRARGLFAVDFCFSALFDGAKVVEAVIPETNRRLLPADFSRIGRDFVGEARGALVWKPKTSHRPGEVASALICSLSPSVAQPVGVLVLGHTQARSFAASEVFLLQSLAAELSWAVRNLRLNNQQQSRLATLSRAARRPLRGILGAAARLTVDPARLGREEQRAQAQELKASARELLCALDRFARPARAENQKVFLTRKPVRVNAVLKEICAYYRAFAEERGLKLELRLAADLPDVIVTDPFNFRQMISHLIGTVCDSAKQMNVEVGATRSETMLEITAKETPQSGDPEVGAQELFSADALHRRIRDGIGIVKELSALLNGHVHALEKPGEVLELTVCVPCE